MNELGKIDILDWVEHGDPSDTDPSTATFQDRSLLVRTAIGVPLLDEEQRLKEDNQALIARRKNLKGVLALLEGIEDPEITAEGMEPCFIALGENWRFDRPRKGTYSDFRLRVSEVVGCAPDSLLTARVVSFFTTLLSLADSKGGRRVPAKTEEAGGIKLIKDRGIVVEDPQKFFAAIDSVNVPTRRAYPKAVRQGIKRATQALGQPLAGVIELLDETDNDANLVQPCFIEIGDADHHGSKAQRENHRDFRARVASVLDRPPVSERVVRITAFFVRVMQFNIYGHDALLGVGIQVVEISGLKITDPR
jgi:hypothetical protein